MRQSWTDAYDSAGNITAISQNDSQIAAYEYDEQGQLLEETRDGVTYRYTYDTAGNILDVTVSGIYSSYKAFTYGNDTWKDLLTTIKIGSTSQSISYDASGNPTNWYNGNTLTNLTWSKGRQLTNLNKGTTAISYTYDMSGIRSSKTVDGATYNYITQNGQVVRQTWGSKILDIVYDNNGQPFALSYAADGVNFNDYYYITNVQGDVVRLVDDEGATVANYTYDAWGKVLTATGTMANINPIRYRGYYYDTETGWYYVSSRYYDPEIGRFINADDVTMLGANGDFASVNLFAYCGNNPVNRFDVNGNFSVPNWLKVTAGVVAIAGLAAATICTGGAAGVIAGAALSGAISGGVSGAIIGGISGGITGGLQGAIDGACSGFASGTLTGAITGAATSGLGMITGTVKVVGSAQKTGTLLHRAASNIEAGKMSVQVWKYSKITLNRSLKTAGLSGRRMPDVIGIARNGTSKLIEVVSKSQTVKQMTNKCISMATENPGATYKVIGWAATISRWFQ